MKTSYSQRVVARNARFRPCVTLRQHRSHHTGGVRWSVSPSIIEPDGSRVHIEHYALYRSKHKALTEGLSIARAHAQLLRLGKLRVVENPSP
jgi:hypothetical protein